MFKFQVGSLWVWNGLIDNTLNLSCHGHKEIILTGRNIIEFSWYLFLFVLWCKVV